MNTKTFLTMTVNRYKKKTDFHIILGKETTSQYYIYTHALWLERLTLFEFIHCR